MSESPGRGLTLKAAGGEGPPVVLIHGFGSDRLSWLANQTAVAAAAAVHTLDLPGHGREPLVECSLDQIAASVTAALDAAGLQDAAVVGHSLGGAIATIVAARRPDLVRALALIAPVGLGQGVDAEFLERFPALTEADEAEALMHRLVSRPRLISKPLVAGVLKQLAASDRREALARIAALLTSDGDAIAAAAAAIAARDLPRLVVWGAEDRINRPDPARVSNFGGRFVEIPDAGHLPHVESPAAVNAALLSFLATCARDIAPPPR